MSNKSSLYSCEDNKYYKDIEKLKNIALSTHYKLQLLHSKNHYKFDDNQLEFLLQDIAIGKCDGDRIAVSKRVEWHMLNSYKEGLSEELSARLPSSFVQTDCPSYSPLSLKSKEKDLEDEIKCNSKKRIEEALNRKISTTASQKISVPVSYRNRISSTDLENKDNYKTRLKRDESATNLHSKLIHEKKKVRIKEMKLQKHDREKRRQLLKDHKVKSLLSYSHPAQNRLKKINNPIISIPPIHHSLQPSVNIQPDNRQKYVSYMDEIVKLQEEEISQKHPKGTLHKRSLVLQKNTNVPIHISTLTEQRQPTITLPPSERQDTCTNQGLYVYKHNSESENEVKPDVLNQKESHNTILHNDNFEALDIEALANTVTGLVNATAENYKALARLINKEKVESSSTSHRDDNWMLNNNDKQTERKKVSAILNSLSKDDLWCDGFPVGEITSSQERVATSGFDRKIFMDRLEQRLDAVLNSLPNARFLKPSAVNDPVATTSGRRSPDTVPGKMVPKDIVASLVRRNSSNSNSQSLSKPATENRSEECAEGRSREEYKDSFESEEESVEVQETSIENGDERLKKNVSEEKSEGKGGENEEKENKGKNTAYDERNDKKPYVKDTERKIVGNEEENAKKVEEVRDREKEETRISDDEKAKHTEEGTRESVKEETVKNEEQIGSKHEDEKQDKLKEEEKEIKMASPPQIESVSDAKTSSLSTESDLERDKEQPLSSAKAVLSPSHSSPTPLQQRPPQVKTTVNTHAPIKESQLVTPRDKLAKQNSSSDKSLQLESSKNKDSENDEATSADAGETLSSHPPSERTPCLPEKRELEEQDEDTLNGDSLLEESLRNSCPGDRDLVGTTSGNTLPVEQHSLVKASDSFSPGQTVLPSIMIGDVTISEGELEFEASISDIHSCDSIDIKFCTKDFGLSRVCVPASVVVCGSDPREAFLATKETQTTEDLSSEHSLVVCESSFSQGGLALTDQRSTKGDCATHGRRLSVGEVPPEGKPVPEDVQPSPEDVQSLRKRNEVLIRRLASFTGRFCLPCEGTTPPD